MSARVNRLGISAVRLTLKPDICLARLARPKSFVNYESNAPSSLPKWPRCAKCSRSSAAEPSSTRAAASQLISPTMDSVVGEGRDLMRGRASDPGGWASSAGVISDRDRPTRSPPARRLPPA